MSEPISCYDAYELFLHTLNSKPVTEREKALCRAFFRAAWEAKEIELSASQAREAALRADLSKVRHALNAGMRETAETKRKLEAAEARIKELELQATAKAISDAHPFRSEAEIELQRQVEFWKSSSQEWKLAYVAIGGTASESGKEELRKLLESKVPEDVRYFIQRVTLHLQSSRSKTPEQLDAMFQEAYALYVKYDVEGRNAPQPKEPKQ